jgi:hypothetical protein
MTPAQRAHGEKIARRKVKGFAFVKPGGDINWSQIARYSMWLAATRKTADAPPVSPAPPPPAPAPVATVPAVSDGAARLCVAIAKSGLTIPQIARIVECERSTIHQAAKGKPALAVAAGGRLLAWVEAVEKK